MMGQIMDVLKPPKRRPVLLLSAKGMLVEERLTLSLHLFSIGYDSPSHILITVTVSLVVDILPPP